ncbi:hypothetical protein J9317_08050 [Metabacillus sp. KIGAM252]|uniref:Uncharacterized protein n=1 Tax=Metabacillus flavus TaxID=2823519 RepID=A0ABS5LDP1_9BACI|nr:hypothetical protein [Metabacillus flavus]MBS2968708.1 hypothetical protein [Metabacillus flavus]
MKGLMLQDTSSSKRKSPFLSAICNKRPLFYNGSTGWLYKLSIAKGLNPAPELNLEAVKHIRCKLPADQVKKHLDVKKLMRTAEGGCKE